MIIVPHIIFYFLLDFTDDMGMNTDKYSQSDSVLPKTKFKPYLKPYWDTTLKDLHAAMRGKRRNWIREGRPRGHTHLSYREYKLTKCLFRTYHRKCAEKFLTELDSDIDQAAEVDSAVF